MNTEDSHNFSEKINLNFFMCINLILLVDPVYKLSCCGDEEINYRTNRDRVREKKKRYI
jgi:hypothetical protein